MKTKFTTPLLFLCTFLLLLSCGRKPSPTPPGLQDAYPEELNDTTPDENGLYYGKIDTLVTDAPRYESIRNGFVEYFECVKSGDINGAISHIYPGLFKWALSLDPNYSKSEVQKMIASRIVEENKKMTSTLARHFEGFKEARIEAIDIKEQRHNANNWLYKIDYAFIIYCGDVADGKYYHMKDYSLAISTDGGKTWYYIEPSSDTEEVLQGLF